MPQQTLNGSAAHLELGSIHPELAATEEFSVEYISPSGAKKLLDSQQINRQINRQIVRKYAEAMRRGEWQYNPQPIILFKGKDNVEHLVDGQHRLTAVVESETTQKFAIATHRSKTIQKVIDCGYRRTLTHQSQILSLNFSGFKISILRCAFWTPAKAKAIKVSDDKILEMGEKYQEFLDISAKISSDKCRQSYGYVRCAALRCLVVAVGELEDTDCIERVQQWLRIVQSGLPASEADWAACILRQELETAKKLKLNFKDKHRLMQLSYASLCKFLNETPVKSLLPLEKQPWPHPDFDGLS